MVANQIQHARESGERFLALVVVIAEADSHLVSDRTLFHSPDEQIDFLLLQEAGEFEGLESSTMMVPWSQSSRSCS